MADEKTRVPIVFLQTNVSNQYDRVSPLFSANALYHLKAYLDAREDVRKGCEIEIMDLGSFGPLNPGERAEYSLVPMNYLVSKNPSVIAFSLYVWNVVVLSEVARNLRMILPDTILVAGGPEVSERPSFGSAHPHFDLLVEGNGELPLAAILTRVMDGSRDFTGIPNVSRLDGETYVHGEASRQTVELDATPNFYADHPEQIREHVFFLGNCGCPNRCDYCLWATQPLRSKSTDKILDELRTLAQRPTVDGLVMFDYDLLEIHRENPELFHRILKILLSDRDDLHLSFFTSPKSMTDPQLADLLRTGRVTALLGVQSLLPEALRAVSRGWSVEDTREDRFAAVPEDIRHEFILELIFPLPEETPESFVEAIKFLLRRGFHRLMIFQLMVLRGTRLHRHGEALGLKHLERPPYLCYETPTSSGEETLRMSVMGTIYTQLIIALETFQDHRSLSAYFRQAPEVIDRILAWISEGWPPDEILRTLIEEITGIRYEGGFCNQEFMVYKARPATLEATGANVNPSAWNQLERDLREHLSAGFGDVVVKESAADSVLLEVTKGDQRTQVSVFREASQRLYYKTTGEYAVAYSGDEALGVAASDELLIVLQNRFG